MYSHRNEHIVNFGTGTSLIKTDGVSPCNDLKEPHIHPIEAKDLGSGSQKKSSPRENKRRQFSLIAQFMGMTEIKFSRWVISAAPFDREEVLRDYKRRK